MHDSTSACDYLILGAGSAGCVLASRLSEDANARVLLLEAGGADDNPDIHDPRGVFVVRKGPEDWAYLTTPQQHCSNRQIEWPRGRVLGGSSSINAMIYIRGHRADYDAWAYLGNPGWDFDRVLPYFRKSEDFDRGASEWHGVGGPLHVLSDYEPHPWHSAVVEGAGEVGFPYTHDFNAAQMAGAGFAHLTVKDGKRHSTAQAFLVPAQTRPNLVVETRARARKLLFDRTRCVGVEYVQDGELKAARASREVIVSGGTIESPRLLMLSGIGPANELRRLGIGVVADLPGVGQNLHDHPLVPLVYSSKRPMPATRPGLQPLHSQLFWYTDERLPAPDLQPVFFHVPLYASERDLPEHGYTFGVGFVRPVSRGTLKLSASDPEAPLLLDPNYLAEPHDVKALEIAFDICRKIAASSSLSEWRGEEVFPGEQVRGKDLQQYIRNTVRSYHHQVGTCKMGIDHQAVVDPELRVHGVEALRVVDASIMPNVTSGNTNAPVIMIAEKAADMIKAAAR